MQQGGAVVLMAPSAGRAPGQLAACVGEHGPARVVPVGAEGRAREGGGSRSAWVASFLIS